VVRRGGAVEGRKKGGGTWAGPARRASSALTLLEGPASVIADLFRRANSMMLARAKASPLGRSDSNSRRSDGSRFRSSA
jgi:hypothetical protein